MLFCIASELMCVCVCAIAIHVIFYNARTTRIVKIVFNALEYVNI